MAARKKTPAKKRPGSSGVRGGIVRFKTGFPAGIRNAIRRRFGDHWHLSLQILDGDDGDGDDGDGDDGSARSSPAPARKRASRPAKKRPSGRKRGGSR